MDQEAILTELTAWGDEHRHNKARNDLVRRAHAAGIEKTEIHRRTGLGRATINRILKETPMDPQDAYQIGHDDGANGGQSLYPEALDPDARAAYERGINDGTT